ncbi:glycosyltransferase [Methanonatronarchaeum sp. AMET-Sl]|uniref:glycosyltransferase family 4 protein n=1 Tax=Methanonatronarchaeum sp. AMET-Sl TaxID=3037654 RepID=UPI00244DCC8D|nr:glycosyltransferase [Methanonatronarchaeum sp. AMET-Sl]WGI17634.1 glycosyltransferase [Methanonatronarchaeum sp. AMET-Sl]
MKIFCKSFPPHLGGDGILVENYLKHGERNAHVYTVGSGESPDNVTFLSPEYDSTYRKKAREIASDDEMLWVHSTRLGIDLNKKMTKNDFLTVHGLFGLIPRKTDIWWKHYRNKIAEYIYFKFLCNSQVTVVSPYSKEKLSKYINPHHIPNGVNFTGFKDTEKEKKAVFLGRHHPQKDLKLVTKIAKYLTQQGYQVHIGGKPNKYSLNQKWNKIDKLTHGYLTEEEKQKWLEESKYLIQPSKWEGLPITLMESLKHKCIPIIRNYSNINKTDLSKYFIFVNQKNYKNKLQKTEYTEHDFKKLKKLLNGKYNWKNIIKQYDKLFTVKENEI